MLCNACDKMVQRYSKMQIPFLATRSPFSASLLKWVVCTTQLHCLAARIFWSHHAIIFRTEMVCATLCYIFVEAFADVYSGTPAMSTFNNLDPMFKLSRGNHLLSVDVTMRIMRLTA